ncbi:MAG: DNA methyltransferase [bacterium]
MDLTPYHAQYLAYELTRRCPSDSDDRLAGALVDAQVDLNPHQIEAALFAFRSPLAKGAILADEVGLGKTIEAGLVLSQKWAEHRRRVLVITPANLRKQWYQELTEKFFLPCRILESRSYNEAVRRGDFRPFETDAVVIASYQFARSKAADVHALPWDLVVIDEAHRLRNVYKPSNVIAQTLKQALAGAPKLLLTATPLQNSLLELFGLVSFVDEHTFGDLRSFREQFARLDDQEMFALLRSRLRPVCHRTLRRQVLPYVRYTKRLPLVQPFTPEESEDRLYAAVSDYLQRDNLQALPASQRSLMTLVLRKLLASSTFAIAGALETLTRRLRARLARAAPRPEDSDGVVEDYEALEATAEEWTDDEPAEALEPAARAAIDQEIADLDGFRALALSIPHNAKGTSLLTALQRGFAAAERLGGSRKAIIFTESRRTQTYLLRLLADSPFADGIVLFNGSNTDERSRAIYAAWLEEHAGSDRVTNSRTADMRSALVDYFREQGRIMIATEAGAEGINLQFCSLVVNYDLPWNPQRIEQRIGRCHRYGQKHDVVVVNFLNQHNAADQRVFELLSEKFQLFDGVFGASDEVLGAIESGVDFEKRIAAIYQRCRRPEDINAAFDQLQLELGGQIDAAMAHTRQQLLEHFDDEVRDKLRVRDVASRATLGAFERMLMTLTRYELHAHAEFLGDAGFRLHTCPFGGDTPLGLYELPRRSGEAHLYRLGHPLALRLIERARCRPLPLAEVVFDYDSHVGRVSALEPHLGQSGVLRLAIATVESLDRAEDYLVCAALTDSGEALEENAARRLFALPAHVGGKCDAIDSAAHLDALIEARCEASQRAVAARNAADFEAEALKLDGWADDLKIGLEREIRDLDREIKEARRAAAAGVTLDAKLAGQKRIKALETQRNARRRALFDAQDDIDRRRSALIDDIEARLAQRLSVHVAFTCAGTSRAVHAPPLSLSDPVAHHPKLELTWIGKEHRPKLEPRILLEDPDKSRHAPHRVTDHDFFDNRLIFGDNLLALKALEQEFTGKIKCVYIDPPYNTGAAFEHYDDGVEHSIWLGLMRARIEIIRRLLSADGSLWITIDDNEVHYLKIVCDELFGRENFVASMVWEKADSPRNSARQFSGDHDYVLVYSREPEWQPNRLPRTQEANAIYLNPDADTRGPWLAGDPYANKPYSKGLFTIKGPTGRSFTPPPGRFWRVSEEKLRALDAAGRVWWGPRGDARPSIKRYLSEVGELVPRTLWKKEDVGSNRTSEMRALFPGDASFGTPKPEKLLERVLRIATQPGDLILDSFAGSGTTGAVAHKMGRRWIMVELGQHCHTHIIPRLKKVIDGEDGGGITDAVAWKGGGGFRYYHLAPSLLEKDRWGNWVVNRAYNPAMLAEAVCKLAGFTYAPSETLWWQHGQSTERDFIYVTTQNLGVEQLQALSDEVGPERTLLVMCSAFRSKPDAFANLTLKKIPRAVLGRCEWGKDDYSLRVENLPQPPSPPGQQDLFE